MTSWKSQQNKDKEIYLAYGKYFGLRTSTDYFTHIYDKYCSSLHNKSFLNVLEIGIADTGGYMAIMPNIKRRVGLDTCIGFLQEHDLLPLTHWIKYRNGSAEEMPFKKEDFDLVIISNALDHCQNMNKVVDEIERVLRPDGYILFCTFLRVSNPHPWTFHSSEEAFKMFNRFKVIEQHEIADIRPFFKRSNMYVGIFKK